MVSSACVTLQATRGHGRIDRGHASNPEAYAFPASAVQSGSERVLKAMNRGHGIDYYLDVASRVRVARPDMALSGDFIVGFPGETDTDFEDTLRLIESVNYACAYCFKYSARPGTPAADHPDQVPDDVVAARLARIQALIHTQQTAFNRACVGKTLPVLLEKPGRDEGQLVGRSPYLQPIHVKGQKAQIGTVLSVNIVGVGTNSLSGHIGMVEHDSEV
jgi:tRNA-2-methylthio-N6-dimethylallyladenosine synthase